MEGELWSLSRLQHSFPDPPPPGRAEVWSRNTAELQTGLLHLLIMSNLLALLGFQGENPLRDLITDSSGDVAHLHTPRLSDADASPVEISDADIHPFKAAGWR